MPAPSVERRLAAILAANVVGYSRLIEQDEAGTLARLKALRQAVIEPILAGHGGRIVKLMGDGALGSRLIQIHQVTAMAMATAAA